MYLLRQNMSFGIMMKRWIWIFAPKIFSIFFFVSQVISYYSNRGGLGGVSLVTVKGVETVSQLLIKDANEKDEVSLFIFQVWKSVKTCEEQIAFSGILHVWSFMLSWCNNSRLCSWRWVTVYLLSYPNFDTPLTHSVWKSFKKSHFTILRAFWGKL